jgi:hypothetical protein
MNPIRRGYLRALLLRAPRAGGGRRAGRGNARLTAVLLAMLLLMPALAHAEVAAQGPDTAQGLEATPLRLRIGVTQDGIMAVRPDDFAKAGINPAAIDPRTFAMSSLGQPVAVYVTGEEDGKFDGSDALHFFGQKFRGPEMDQKYTDERVYWLDAGGARGPRITGAPAHPEFDVTPPADTPTTLRAEENLWWWSLHTILLDTQDTWFWARNQPLSSSKVVSATLPYTVPFPAANAPALFRMEQISRVGRWDIAPDHRTTVSINGRPLLDREWDGLRVRKVFTATLSPGILIHGLNQVSVGAWTLPDILVDDIYTNYWELEYRREFKAFEGRFDFTKEVSGVQEYVVSGWESEPVWVWDVSNPNQPVRLMLTAPVSKRLFLPLLQSGSVSSPATSAIRFRTTGEAGSRYWLQAGATINSPASVRLRPPTGLRSAPNQYDVVLVAPSYLMASAQPLKSWHESNGRRALIVDIQDAYDEFNEGINHPKAIQGMMKWAANNWQKPAPQYLTLVGDGHWNFKGYNPTQYTPQPNPIPPYLVWVDYWQGEVPADSRLGDINDDNVPDIAVGRLPVNTPAEAQVVIQKIISYDQGARTADWQKRGLFVADNADYAGDFPLVTKEIVAGYTPADIQPIPVYLSEAPIGTPVTNEQIAAARSGIMSALQSGVLFAQYAGHGAPERWAQESRTDVSGDLAGIWRTADIAALQNGPKLPLVMTFNCLDGYFVYPVPSSFSMAELMLRHPGGGSVAAISPTGLGTTDVQHEFRKVLLDVMFKQNVREMGRALTIAKQQYATRPTPPNPAPAAYLIDTMTFFGDPALRLPAQGAQ